MWQNATVTQNLRRNTRGHACCIILLTLLFNLLLLKSVSSHQSINVHVLKIFCLKYPICMVSVISKCFNKSSYAVYFLFLTHHSSSHQGSVYVSDFFSVYIVQKQTIANSDVPALESSFNKVVPILPRRTSNSIRRISQHLPFWRSSLA